MTTTITLSGDPYALSWNKGAMFRADKAGLWSSQSATGFSDAATYVWAMLPPAGRSKFRDAEAVAEALPALTEVWPVINEAIEAGGEATAPKNVFGSMNGPSPASS